MKYFAEAERLLSKEGFKVVNPTRFFICRYIWVYRLLGYRLTLLYDLWRLMRCDMIYKLPGWQQSRGANIESCVAYHMKVWPVAKNVIERTDKRIEKLIINFENSNGNTTKNYPFAAGRRSDGQLHHHPVCASDRAQDGHRA